MKQLVNEKRARLTALERELVQRVSHSRFFDQRTCTYTAPRAKMPRRVKRLIDEIQELRKELGEDDVHSG